MHIAVIGWGSLIWCPGALRLATRWFRDGPLLPIEFARISSDRRLTLVLREGSESQRTLWAVTGLTELLEARTDLQRREGAKNLNSIHSRTAGGECEAGAPADVQDAIGQWLTAHRDIDACIWTGLGSNWRERLQRDFTVQDAVRYIKCLCDIEGQDSVVVRRAREYVQNTPLQIQTEVRRSLREQLNWEDAVLSEVLFER